MYVTAANQRQPCCHGFFIAAEDVAPLDGERYIAAHVTGRIQAGGRIQPSSRAVTPAAANFHQTFL